MAFEGGQDIQLGEENSIGTIVSDASETQIKEQNVLLRNLLKRVDGLVQNSDKDFVALKLSSVRVADAIKREVGVDGFKTVIYGLGGPDLLGASEFLPSSGGNIVTISGEQILDTVSAAFPADPLEAKKWEEVLDEQIKNYARAGRYSSLIKPEEVARRFRPGRATLAFAVNLAIAGVSEEDVNIVSQKVIQYEGTLTNLDTVQIKRGSRLISMNVVSGVWYGDAVVVPQNDIVKSVVDRFQMDQPTVAISKASELMGINVIKDILPPGTALVFDSEWEFEHISGLSTKEIGVEVPQSGGAPGWGYAQSFKNRIGIILSKVPESSFSPSSDSY